MMSSHKLCRIYLCDKIRYIIVSHAKWATSRLIHIWSLEKTLHQAENMIQNIHVQFMHILSPCLRLRLLLFLLRRRFSGRCQWACVWRLSQNFNKSLSGIARNAKLSFRYVFSDGEILRIKRTKKNIKRTRSRLTAISFFLFGWS